MTETITPLELATVLRCSEQELVGLTKQGVLCRTTEERKGRQRIVYAWRENVSAFIDHLQSPAQRAREQYLEEKHATQQIIRAHKELELLKARGVLIDGDHVDREVMGLFSTIKNHMRALPSRISSLLLGLKSRAEIHAVMKKAIDLSLREVTDFDMMQLRRPSGRNGAHDRSSKTKNRARR